MRAALDVRSAFDLPDDRAYLNCAYMGPLPIAAVQAGERALRAKSQPWTVAVDSFFEPVARLRELVAGLLGADVDGVMLAPSASYGVATAAANLDVPTGSSIVLLAEQFPSNVYAWRDLAHRRGARVVTVPRGPDGWTEPLLRAVDEHTAVVALGSCHWTDGTTIDLPAVGAACRAAGASLVVDVSQTLGAVPFDHAGVRPDVVVGVTYKWLLGPYGCSFAWFAPHLRHGRPIELNWITRAGSEDFAGLVDYTDQLQPGARRYDSGEVSSHVNVATAVAALELVTEWGPERIAEHAGVLVDDLTCRAADLGLGVPDRAQRSPHLVGLRLPPDAPPPATIAARLADAGVHVSIRGTSIRVSVHAFTTPTDVTRLIDALAAV